ncbi:MAG TPA: CsbD family protein [Solirubrobacteraceae bacterium]
MATDKNVDEGKGRLKEAAGSLTDDQDLKNEGKSDRAKASVKDKIDEVANKAKDALDRDGK